MRTCMRRRKETAARHPREQHALFTQRFRQIKPLQLHSVYLIAIARDFRLNFSQFHVIGRIRLPHALLSLLDFAPQRFRFTFQRSHLLAKLALLTARELRF